MAEHIVTKAKENIAGTLVESDSISTNHKPHPPLRCIVKLPLDTRREIESVSAVLGVVIKSDVRAIIESRPMKWTNTLQ